MTGLRDWFGVHMWPCAEKREMAGVCDFEQSAVRKKREMA